jgi:hypothetical protein
VVRKRVVRISGSPRHRRRDQARRRRDRDGRFGGRQRRAGDGPPRPRSGSGRQGESLLSNGAPIVVDAAALARYRDSVPTNR